MKRDKVSLKPKGKILQVILTGSYFKCTNCLKIKIGSKFGLRYMDKSIRNQPQCKECR